MLVILLIISLNALVEQQHSAKILILAHKIKNKFSYREIKLLKQEIEKSLDNTINFAKWSCGILTTATILLISSCNNYIVKHFNKINTENIDQIKNINDLLNFKIPLEIIIIFYTFLGLITFLMFYYLLFQVITTNKRFALNILKHTQFSNHTKIYKDFYTLSIIRKINKSLKKIKYLIKYFEKLNNKKLK